MVFVKSFLSDDSSMNINADKGDFLLHDVSFNLMHLFESEAPLMPLDTSLSQVNRSIMRYGIEDIQSLNYQSKKQDFISNLKQLLYTFESRIEDVEIRILNQGDDQSLLHTQTVHFVVEGTLKDGHEFLFNSEIKLGELDVNMENDLD